MTHADGTLINPFTGLPETADERAIRHARLEGYWREQLRNRSDALDHLRRRAGFSMNELAKEMGFKSASSIQRYLTPDYDRGFRPEISRAFRQALLGKGNPPIVDEDLLFLLHEKQLEPSDPAWNTHQLVARMVEHQKVLNARPSGVPGRFKANLPLVEGDVWVDMPRHLSIKSANALKTWAEHLADYAEEQQKLANEPNYYDGTDPNRGKTWE